MSEWRNYSTEKRLPKGIPSNPNRIYKQEWISWGDWLGTGTIAAQITGWTIQKVKDLVFENS